MTGPTPAPDSPLRLAQVEVVEDEMIDPDDAVRSSTSPGRRSDACGASTSRPRTPGSASS